MSPWYEVRNNLRQSNYIQKFIIESFLNRAVVIILSMIVYF
nr:MAG TPA: hypothetical protein [Caudoviricetes sp.]